MIRTDYAITFEQVNRYSALTKEDGSHLLWTGNLNAQGYGRFAGKLVHCIEWEMFNGPIPEGMEIDHVCRVKRCIALEHLELVTHAENIRRAVPYRDTLHHKRRYRCVYGHWARDLDREWREAHGLTGMVAQPLLTVTDRSR